MSPTPHVLLHMPRCIYTTLLSRVSPRATHPVLYLRPEQLSDHLPRCITLHSSLQWIQPTSPRVLRPITPFTSVKCSSLEARTGFVRTCSLRWSVIGTHRRVVPNFSVHPEELQESTKKKLNDRGYFYANSNAGLGWTDRANRYAPSLRPSVSKSIGSMGTDSSGAGRHSTDGASFRAHVLTLILAI